MSKNNKKIILYIGTYPPLEEGIATFTRDLVKATQMIVSNNADCKVAAVTLSKASIPRYPDEVIFELDQDAEEDYLELARKVNGDPHIIGVIVQHEYGIFGGEWGEYITSFIKNCSKPVLTTFHTVLPTPPGSLYRITKDIIDSSDGIIVLTKNSKTTLNKVYPESIGKTFVVPHGIHPVIFITPKKGKKIMHFQGNTILTTFGLLSRGKGIEYVINALPNVVAKHSSVLYLILGQTHPLVRREEGEKYRLELIQLVNDLGLKKNVKFLDKFLDLKEILTYLQATNIYIATSLNPDQAVSGTFSYAIGTGRATVSTAFNQAKEVVTSATGRIVPIKDSVAYANALNELLDNPKKLRKMHRAAYNKTRSMLWSNVAHDNVEILKTFLNHNSNSIVLPKIKLSHLRKMTNKIGLFQFARYSLPDPEFGYTLDDNARALIFCSWDMEKGNKRTLKLLFKYLNFIERCQLENGRFINYLDKDGLPTEQNRSEDLEDATARAMWSLSEVIANHNLSAITRNKAKKIWERSEYFLDKVHYPRSRAFIIKALVNLIKVSPSERLRNNLILHSDHLIQMYEKNVQKNWYWFESHMTYTNALLPEALILSGSLLKNKNYLETGKKTLKFLLKTTFKGDVYVPIGQKGWAKRRGPRSEFGQQPEDPSAMILALTTAYNVFKDIHYSRTAKKCFTWYLGNNLIGIPLYNHQTGGCYDGLEKKGVNLNQGAESLISYLLARLAVEKVN